MITCDPNHAFILTKMSTMLLLAKKLSACQFRFFQVKTLVPVMRFLFPLALLQFASTTYVHGEELKLDGDAKLLQFLYDAQVNNVELYQTGQLSAVSETGRADPERPEERFEFNLKWSARKCRLQVKHTFLGIPPERLKTTQAEYAMKIISTPELFITYSPEHQAVRIESSLLSGPDELLNLRPEQFWYGQGLKFRELLNTSSVGRTRLRSCKIRQINDDIIEFTRLNESTNALSIRASLRDNGNVVAAISDTPNAGPNQIRRRERYYNWTRDDKERCVLKAYRQIATTLDTDLKAISYYTKIDINHVDLDYKPSADLFDMKSFSLPNGTKVEDKIKKRTYSIGDVEVKTMSKLLDSLVPHVKSRGFAQPTQQKTGPQ